MGLYAGDLRHRVTIMRKSMVKAADGNGGLTAMWSPIGTVYAQVLGISGREAVIGQALQGVAYYKVTIRYRGDVSAADQLAYRPAGAPEPLTLNIRSATDPDGARERLEILADTASAQALG